MQLAVLSPLPSPLPLSQPSTQPSPLLEMVIAPLLTTALLVLEAAEELWRPAGRWTVRRPLMPACQL